MGLDYSICKKRKDQSIEDFFKNYDSSCELAYGRKSWDLVGRLATEGEIENSYGILRKDSWEALMKDMDPIGDLLPKIKEAYSHYDFYLDHLEDKDRDIIDKSNIIFTKEDKKLIAQFEYWYDRTFDQPPTLGYDWAAGYLDNFYKVKDQVRELLDDPEYEVAQVISW